jgi:hypothetical protein
MRLGNVCDVGHACVVNMKCASVSSLSMGNSIWRLAERQGVVADDDSRPAPMVPDTWLDNANHHSTNSGESQFTLHDLNSQGGPALVHTTGREAVDDLDTLCCRVCTDMIPSLPFLSAKLADFVSPALER